LKIPRGNYCRRAKPEALGLRKVGRDFVPRKGLSKKTGFIKDRCFIE